MLLRHRTPEFDTAPATLAPGLEHLDQGWVAVLRWLNTNKVDCVLVGPVAHAIRGELTARGPVAIVPAPYIRNYERLAAALVAQDATLRSERGLRGVDSRVEIKLTADKLARGRRWLLRFAGYDLDVENSSTRPGTGRGPHQESRGAHPQAGPPGDGARYQELLYESARYQITDGVSAEVAAPEDLELYSHMRRTGVAPEFRITRNEDAPGDRSATRDASLPDA
jgi:hypothetical protein